MCDTSRNCVFVDDCTALKENLSDEIEYSLLPKAAWDKLVSWYGLQQGQVCIMKKE